MPSLSRRTLLEAAVRGAAGASLALFPGVGAWIAQAQTAAGAARDLGDGLHVLTVGATNVLAATGADGIALVDGASAAEAGALRDLLAALPGGGSVHTLFNTHWHPEQTGSNEALGNAGATIVAHVNTKLWLTTDVTWPWNGETIEPLADVALPNETFYDHAELTVGGRNVQCGYLSDCPHTDGDIYVLFPDANVLAVGDAVTGAGWPELDWWTGGWAGGLVGGLDILLTVSNAETTFVPARGPVLSRADMETQYAMYSLIWERLTMLLYGGAGPEDAVAAAPTKEFEAVMGPSEEFVRRAFRSLWAYLSPDA